MATMLAEPGTPSSMHMSRVPLCIKNTFIEVDEPSPQQRFSSLPPSLRLSGNNGLPVRATNRCASPVKDKLYSQSPSNASRSGETDEVSTQADNSEAEDTNSEAEAASTGDDDKVTSPVEPPPVAHSRLNSRAKLWTPGAAAVVPRQLSWEHCEFAQKLKGIAAAVHTVLVNCVWVSIAEANESHLGWNIIAQVASRDAHQTETTLALGKQAIISAAEVSAPLWLLGYNSRPFVDTVGGFSARFAGVSDKHSACWGLLQQGFCRYGESCRWKHPTYHATINVAIVIAER